MALEMKPRGTGRQKARLARRLFGEYNRDQNLFVAEAMLINSANVITGGVFLTGLLLMMGASNLTVGLVMSSGSWSLLLSLVSSVIVERVRRKKALLAGVALVFRMLTALPVFLPAIMGTGLPTALTAAVMIVAGNAVFSIYNTGFNIFFMDSIPVEGRTRYIYFRMFMIRSAYTVFSLLLGIMLDLMHKSYAGFIIVFSLGLVMGAADALVITMIRGQGEAENAGAARLGFRHQIRMLVEPLKNAAYIRYLTFIFAFFFFLSMSSAYTSLYQYKYLELSVFFITALTTVTYVIMIALTNTWARLEERFGRMNVVAVSALLMALEFFVYGFLTTKSLVLIALSPVFSGVGSSGFWASLLPYRYDLMPPQGKTAYEAWHGVAFGAANLLGALVGGQLQTVLPVITLPFMAFSVFQIVYFLSGVLAVAAVAAFWLLSRKDGRACRT